MATVTNEIRCTGCQKKICEAVIKDGEIKIKCPKCGTLNTIKAEQVTPKREDHRGFQYGRTTQNPG